MRGKWIVLAAGITIIVMSDVRIANANPPVEAIAIASAPIVLWSLFEEQPTTHDPNLLTITGGWFDVWQQEKSAALFGAEFRSNLWVWKAKPFIGTIGTS